MLLRFRPLPNENSRKEILTLAADGAHVEAIPCDVRLEGSCRAAVELAIVALGPPDWAVACAGIVKPLLQGVPSFGFGQCPFDALKGEKGNSGLLTDGVSTDGRRCLDF